MVYKKMIIPYETERARKKIEEQKRLINKKITILLESILPNRILTARKVCGDAPFVIHPGFIWKTGKNFGNRSMWVTPDVPYYFPQFTEQKEIEQWKNPYDVEQVHRAVMKYYDMAEKLDVRETSIAIKLASVNSFDDLINYDPEVFCYVYEKFAADKLEEARISREDDDEDIAEAIENNILDLKPLIHEYQEKYELS
jgi:hypothetical protein